jgi:Holliday junction resolvasome RuvABC ATP-dependent DNA helicase subunit
MTIQRELATLLLRIDLKNVVFINEANARSKYRKEYLWHTLEEYYYLDIKGSTTKQAY